MKTLAVVPARGGSRGLPGKNARLFRGESLLGRAIRIGLETCDAVVVSTDSPELAQIAAAYGAPVRLRPAELATDEAPMLPVVQDAIAGREGDVIVLLQPTQPMRTAEQVRAAVELLTVGVSSVVSVRRVPDIYAPERLLILEEGWLVPAMAFAGKDPPRRQDAQPAYMRDGTVYVTRRSVVDDGSLYGRYGSCCLPLMLEGDALSIDTLEDFERLEAMAGAR